MCIKLKNHTRPDGRAVLLLLLEGTLPIFYRGTRYNIPVVMWLPENYPRQSPFVYVTPTHDMIIKPNHSFVDPTGLVRSIYINNWQYPRSNLNEMAHDTAIQFGTEPPLFSKPPGWSGSHPAPTTATARPPEPQLPLSPPVQPSQSASADSAPTVQVHNPLQQGQSQRPFGSIWGAPPSRPSADVPTGATTPHPEPLPVATKQQLQDAFRSAAIESLVLRLRDRLVEEQQAQGSEMQELRDVQAKLRANEQQLERMVASAAAERDELERALTEMSVKRVEMESWLHEYETKVPASSGDIDPNTAIVPVDDLSSQALDAHAADLAIEETLYALDKALQRGLLQPEVYLKQVRRLCRKQYYARALGNKVAARQQQAVAAMNRMQQRNLTNTSLQMPQGDSWVSTGVLPNPLAAAMR